MLATEFNKVVEDQFDICRSLMVDKAGEYATEDRLFNFKQPTSMMHQNQAQVCLSYQMKHMASCVKIAEDMNKGIFPTDEMLNEKITDMINYCLLFKANVMELRNYYAQKTKDVL